MSFDFTEKDTTVLLNPSLLSASDLQEEYKILSAKYLQFKQANDKLQQDNYQLKRDIALSGMREATLNDEMQSITDIHSAELAEIQRKNSIEINELRNRLYDEKHSKENLEHEIERLNREIQILAKGSQEKQSTIAKPLNPNETIVLIDRLESLEKHEANHYEYVQQVNQKNIEIDDLKMKLGRLKSELDDIQEYYECAKENLNHKNDEVVNLQQINETLQEKVAELSNELASYQNGNVDHNKKGNSLFAEVDDQRQQMRDLLSKQKDRYYWMKERYEDGQKEIRRLKRENADIHGEVKNCIKMLRNNQTIKEKSIFEHAAFQNREIERLKEKLAWTESKLLQTAKEHGVTWLDSMMEYCRNETSKLQRDVDFDGLRACRAEHAAADAEERAVKWRFEALKSRCIIIDRELLLEKNNIPFEPPPKYMKKIVQERFDDLSKEEPQIDELPSSANEATVAPTKDLNESSSTNISNSSSGIESDVQQIPIEQAEPLLTHDNIKQAIIESNESFCESKWNNETLIRAQEKVTQSSIAQSQNLNIKQENKENFNETNYGVTSQASLADEIKVFSTGTPVPKFRQLNLSSQRKQELRQITNDLVNDNNEASSIPVKVEVKPEMTPPTRIKQYSRGKFKVVVRSIGGPKRE